MNGTMTCLEVRMVGGRPMMYRYKVACTHPDIYVSCKYPHTHWRCCCGAEWPAGTDKPAKVEVRQ